MSSMSVISESLLASSFCRIYILCTGKEAFLICTVGQLLETAIIADRVYYLQKHGATVQVHCAFDRKKSPRCMCITATK